MKRKWEFEIDESNSTIEIFLETSEAGKIKISGNLRGIDEVKRELDNIKKELDEALELFQQKQREQEREVLNPEDIWRKMSLMDSEQMCAYFNSLDAETRKQVADFVFSHVNMFSGAGPVFAELYDPATGLMDND